MHHGHTLYTGGCGLGEVWSGSERLGAAWSGYDRKSLRDTGNREAKSNRCTRGAFETRSLLPLSKINNNARVAGCCSWDDTTGAGLLTIFQLVTNQPRISSFTLVFFFFLFLLLITAPLVCRVTRGRMKRDIAVGSL